MRYKAKVKAITREEVDRRIAALERSFRGMVAAILKMRGIEGATPKQLGRLANRAKEPSRG